MFYTSDGSYYSSNIVLVAYGQNYVMCNRREVEKYSGGSAKQPQTDDMCKGENEHFVNKSWA